MAAPCVPRESVEDREGLSRGPSPTLVLSKTQIGSFSLHPKFILIEHPSPGPAPHCHWGADLSFCCHFCRVVGPAAFWMTHQAVTGTATQARESYQAEELKHGETWWNHVHENIYIYNITYIYIYIYIWIDRHIFIQPVYVYKYAAYIYGELECGRQNVYVLSCCFALRLVDLQDINICMCIYIVLTQVLHIWI